MSNAAINDRLLRGAEVAEVIGCSRAMAYRLMQRGTIPVVRIPGGKTVRVPREALLVWIKDNTRGGADACGVADPAHPAQPSGRKRSARRSV
jgi:excisionase family DNA binding protein